MAQAQQSRRILDAASVPNANGNSIFGSHSNSHRHRHSHSNKLKNYIGNNRRYGKKYTELKDQFEKEIADLRTKFDVDMDECAADREREMDECAAKQQALEETMNQEIDELNHKLEECVAKHEAEMSQCAVVKEELEAKDEQICELEKKIGVVSEKLQAQDKSIEELERTSQECVRSSQHAIDELRTCAEEKNKCFGERDALQANANVASLKTENEQLLAKVAKFEAIVCNSKSGARRRLQELNTNAPPPEFPSLCGDDSDADAAAAAAKEQCLSDNAALKHENAGLLAKLAALEKKFNNIREAHAKRRLESETDGLKEDASALPAAANMKQCLSDNAALKDENAKLSAKVADLEMKIKIICGNRRRLKISTGAVPAPDPVDSLCSDDSGAARRRLQSDSVGAANALYAADQIVCDALTAQDEAGAGAIDLDVALNLNACVMGSQYVVVDSVLHLQTFSDALCQAELTQFSTCAQFHLQ